jgi:hypothetical protein
MPDWSASMQQTYEYYTVDIGTWKDIRLLGTVRACSITRDSEVETLGSATIDIDESIEECYVRVYLVTTQNGIKEKHPLGTFLLQTPTTDFDGRRSAISADAYTPLMELKENSPPIGYFIPKDSNAMEYAYRLCREHARAPVVPTECPTKISTDFVAYTEDTWLTYVKDILANVKYNLALDELGRILFSPEQDTASLSPIWTYDDSNSSILYPDISVNRDLYGIPNVVEVIYSSGSQNLYAKVVNDDPNSPTSTVSRGRNISHRITDPDLNGEPTQAQIERYAEKVLRELSSLECTITYDHGYCPVRIGDCVRINYPRAKLIDIKAKVISQTIKCEPGCPVTEKAVFTTKLWG